MREIAVMKKLNHGAIITFRDQSIARFTSDETPALVRPLCDGNHQNTLHDLRKRVVIKKINKKLTKKKANKSNVDRIDLSTFLKEYKQGEQDNPGDFYTHRSYGNFHNNSDLYKEIMLKNAYPMEKRKRKKKQKQQEYEEVSLTKNISLHDGHNIGIIRNKMRWILRHIPQLRGGGRNLLPYHYRLHNDDYTEYIHERKIKPTYGDKMNRDRSWYTSIFKRYTSLCTDSMLHENVVGEFNNQVNWVKLCKNVREALAKSMINGCADNSAVILQQEFATALYNASTTEDVYQTWTDSLREENLPHLFNIANIEDEDKS